jgi:hypothetical protein
VIVELGHFALILALVVAAVQTIVPALGAYRRDDRLMAIGEPAAICQFMLLFAAFLALTYAYVNSDFSVANVAQNSHSAKPLIYKISGVWGNHEGSMLLWVLILALFGAAVAMYGQNLPTTLRANVLSVQASIALAFCLYILERPSHFAGPSNRAGEILEITMEGDLIDAPLAGQFDDLFIGAPAQRETAHWTHVAIEARDGPVLDGIDRRAEAEPRGPG